MEFEVTATRKRPITLSQMVGQDFVVATLRNAVENNQIAPAYLFSGPRGTGKTSTARILARSLNCAEGPTVEPCGVCGPCKEIAKGSSPDVIEIDGASNTSVNDVREIKDEVLYAPQGSHKKIYIIDEVHMLSNSAFNALLKTIEEPPPYITFVFATTEIHKVPATIRSRCQQFRFRLFSPELLKSKLSEAAVEIRREFEPDALGWIAREAGGSMRDAYTLFDQVVSFSDEHITLESIREKMGLVGIESTSALVCAAAEGRRGDALEELDEILASGTAIEQVLLELGDFLRNLTLLAYGIEKESLLGMSPERFPETPRKAWDIRRLEEAASDVYDLYRDIRYSLDPRYELELLVGRLCGLRDRLSPEEIVQRIHSLRQELITGNWSDESPMEPSEIKKKNPELNSVQHEGAHTVDSPSTDSQEAQVLFSRFGSGMNKAHPPVSTDPPREPECAIPVDIGLSMPEIGTEVLPAEQEPFEPRETSLTEQESRITEDPKDRLLAHIRRENISYAAALEKALDWHWEDGLLRLTFASGYEGMVVEKESEILRSAGKTLELPNFAIEIETQESTRHDGKPKESDRIALVRQVFRGQVVKG